jgi:hypothetical protein
MAWRGSFPVFPTVLSAALRIKCELSASSGAGYDENVDKILGIANSAIALALVKVAKDVEHLGALAFDLWGAATRSCA